MNNALKMAIAAAAVVVVAIAGISFFRGGTGGPGASPTAIPTPSPSPSLLSASGTLDPGTYYIAAGAVTPGRFTFTVPAGWATSDGFVDRDRGATAASMPPFAGPGDVELVTWIVSHAFTDACHWQASLVPAGTTIDELASLLLAQKGRVASAATDVTLGGLPGQADRVDRAGRSRCHEMRQRSPQVLAGPGPGSVWRPVLQCRRFDRCRVHRRCPRPSLHRRCQASTGHFRGGPGPARGHCRLHQDRLADNQSVLIRRVPVPLTASSVAAAPTRQATDVRFDWSIHSEGSSFSPREIGPSSVTPDELDNRLCSCVRVALTRHDESGRPAVAVLRRSLVSQLSAVGPSC